MTDKTVRSGSLQFWPRKRAARILPSANWSHIAKKNSEKKGLLGFIGYKVGMASVSCKDSSEDSLTKTKKIILPVTIIECPDIKIFSVRFYKNKKVAKDIIVSFNEFLKRKLKKPKQIKKDELDKIDFDYDDLSVIVYSGVNLTGIGKKKPDVVELGLNGSKEEKLNFVKEKLSKDNKISVSEVFSVGPGNLIDIHGVTKGFGFTGPVKRFGISLKAKKSEKGQRRPGSIGSFGMRRVTFRAPQAGQHGFFTRVCYNNVILDLGNVSEKDINKEGGFHKYGKINTSYIILQGSVPGVKKRVLLLTKAGRPTKKQLKKNFEGVKLT